MRLEEQGEHRTCEARNWLNGRDGRCAVLWVPSVYVLHPFCDPPKLARAGSSPAWSLFHFSAARWPRQWSTILFLISGLVLSLTSIKPKCGGIRMPNLASRKRLRKAQCGLACKERTSWDLCFGGLQGLELDAINRGWFGTKA